MPIIDKSRFFKGFGLTMILFLGSVKLNSQVIEAPTNNRFIDKIIPQLEKVIVKDLKVKPNSANFILLSIKQIENNQLLEIKVLSSLTHHEEYLLDENRINQTLMKFTDTLNLSSKNLIKGSYLLPLIVISDVEKMQNSEVSTDFFALLSFCKLISQKRDERETILPTRSIIISNDRINSL